MRGETATARGRPPAPPPSRPGTVARAVVGRDAVLALAPHWDDLTARARGASPFVARAWLEPWIAEGRVAGTPVALTAWSDGRLVALLVVGVRTLGGARVGEAVGIEHPGYHGLLHDGTHGDAPERIAELCADGGVLDALRIDDVAETDGSTDALLRELGRRGFVVARARRNPCHSIRLDGASFDAFLRGRKSGKSIRNLRREERLLRERARIELIRLRGAEITPEALDRAARVQASSWMTRRGAAVLGDAFWRKVAASAAHGGLGHLWLLTVDGEDAAFGYSVTTHDEMHYVWTAFDLRREAHSVGKLLTQWIVGDACRDGVRRFDFGHGDAEYKRFWSTGTHGVDRVVAGRGVRGRAFVLGWQLAWQAAKVEGLRSLARAVRRWARA